jgi:DNA-binding CsgD family transcriptional regulator
MHNNGTLSPREVEILQLVAEERTYQQIGLQLGISGYTVKNHVSRLLRKLEPAGVRTRVGAVLEAIRRGDVVVHGIQACATEKEAS